MTEEQTEKQQTAFQNPYRGIEKRDPENWLRCSVDCDKRDVARIRSVTMDWGYMQIVCAMFVKHLYNYVESNDLEFGDAEQLNQHIVNMLGFASCKSHGERPHGDERSGTGRVCETDKTPSNKSATRKRKQTPAATEGERRVGDAESASQDGRGVEGTP